ncbi:MAG: hypothetical protein KF723_23045 [Rhizobiaceae bacterium]|nr:hypothetical protein [Rhizobiaceae bacterium]
MKPKKFHTVITVLTAEEHAVFAAIAAATGATVEDTAQRLLSAIAASQLADAARLLNAPAEGRAT